MKGIRVRFWKIILILYVILGGSWAFLEMNKTYNFWFRAKGEYSYSLGRYKETIEERANFTEMQYKNFINTLGDKYRTQAIENTTILYCGYKKDILYIIFGIGILLTIFTITQTRFNSIN